MRALSAIGCTALALCACTPLNTNVPASFDLSGHWILDDVASGEPLDLDAIRRREDRKVARGRQSNPGGSAAFVLQDFPVLSATEMRIEQDSASMGIRYDDDTYRDVSWGERERDFWSVRTGWQDGSLVIRSTRGGTRGTEILVLEDAGDRLRVTVRVETEGEDVRTVRIFNRQ